MAVIYKEKLILNFLINKLAKLLISIYFLFYIWTCAIYL